MSSPSHPESPLPVPWSQSQQMQTRRRKVNLSLRLDTIPAFGSHGFSYDCATSTTPGLSHHSKSTSECDSTEPKHNSFLEAHYDDCPPIVIQEDDIQWLMMSPESPLYNPSRVHEPLPRLFPPAIGFCMDVGKADISNDMPQSVGALGALFLGEDYEFHLEETTSIYPVKTKAKGPTLQVDTSAPNYHSFSSIEQGFTLSSLFSSPPEFDMKLSIDDRNAAAGPDESN